MGNLKMRNAQFFLMIAAVVAVSVVVSGLYTTDVETKQQRVGLPIALANLYDCSMSTSDVTSISEGYKTPKSVPEGYGVQDSFTNIGELGLFYATEDMCGPNATIKSFADGVIMYYTANQDSGITTIADPEGYFKAYKSNSDYPDRITVTQIAGHPAILWSSGIEKNIFILESGEIFVLGEVPYPAQITIVDKENGELYMVRGHASLDTLMVMVKSAITP